VILAEEVPPRMTYEAFLASADQDTHGEWVDGAVVPMGPASDEHQDVVGFLNALLRIFIQDRGLGWVRCAPFQMKTGPDLPGREPDIVFLAADHLDRLKPTYINGPADLAVEVVSPESAGRDRGEKFYEYAQGGVAEYWLIDPTTRWAEFYTLQDGHYRTVLAGGEGEFRSGVVSDFWLRVEWLWQAPRPPVPDVLRELGVL
jgi:Uma2 family endonuclease